MVVGTTDSFTCNRTTGSFTDRGSFLVGGLVVGEVVVVVVSTFAAFRTTTFSSDSGNSFFVVGVGVTVVVVVSKTDVVSSYLKNGTQMSNTCIHCLVSSMQATFSDTTIVF